MKELKIHNIHPYHGKFYYGIPQYFIEKYGTECKSIIDPFCGSGTTLVESARYDKECTGIDINFLSYKVTKAKISKVNITKFEEYAKLILNCQNASDINFIDKDYWFSQSNYFDLCCIFNGISLITDDVYKNIFEVALSSILKTCCNKRKVWNNGYIADNVLPNIESKINLRNAFIKKIAYFKSAYKELENLNLDNIRVIKSDIIKYNNINEFDMMITSPPYPFAVDFAKYNRLSYYLFHEDLDAAVKDETGARSKRNTKNCVEEFFSEMQKLYIHIMKMIKIGGYACMTVGNTHRNNKKIDFVNWLIELFEKNGWILLENSERQLKKQSMPQKRIPVEHILVFRRVN